MTRAAPPSLDLPSACFDTIRSALGVGAEPHVAKLTRYVQMGDRTLLPALEDALRHFPSGNVKLPPGPRFWFGAGATANQRLFDVRLATRHGGSLESALDTEHHANSPFEGSVVAARVAEEAGAGAYGTALEPAAEVAGIVYALARDRPALLDVALRSLLEKRAFFTAPKLAILGALPWADGAHAVVGSEYQWVTHWSSTVLRLGGTLDGTKATLAFASADGKLDKVVAKTIAAAEKKIGAKLAPGAPSIPGVHTPAASAVDLLDVARREDRPTLLRALRLGAVPAEIANDVVWAARPWMIFDLMSHGARLPRRAETDAKAREHLTTLQRDLLPSAFDWMCRRGWGDEHAAERAHYGV